MNEIKEYSLVKNKKYGNYETVIREVLMKDSNNGWIPAVLYYGKDRNSDRMLHFVKSKTDFLNEFIFVVPTDDSPWTLTKDELPPFDVEVEAIYRKNGTGEPKLVLGHYKNPTEEDMKSTYKIWCHPYFYETKHNYKMSEIIAWRIPKIPEELCIHQN